MYVIHYISINFFEQMKYKTKSESSNLRMKGEGRSLHPSRRSPYIKKEKRKKGNFICIDFHVFQ